MTNEPVGVVEQSVVELRLKTAKEFAQALRDLIAQEAKHPEWQIDHVAMAIDGRDAVMQSEHLSGAAQPSRSLCNECGRTTEGAVSALRIIHEECYRKLVLSLVQERAYRRKDAELLAGAAQPVPVEQPSEREKTKRAIRAELRVRVLENALGSIRSLVLSCVAQLENGGGTGRVVAYLTAMTDGLGALLSPPPIPTPLPRYRAGEGEQPRSEAAWQRGQREPKSKPEALLSRSEPAPRQETD